MLSAMRTKHEALLLQAARPTCLHSLPGSWYPGSAGIRSVDSRFQNVEGRS